MKKIIGIVISLICLLSSFTLADVGDFESYDSWDGGSDWGGSDWGGSSWSSSDWDSSDWGYSDYGYGYSNSSDGGIGFVFIVIVVIIIIASQNVSKNKMNSSTVQPRTNYPKDNYRGGYVRSQVRSEAVAEEVRKVDKYFNDEQFLSWAKNLFVKLQTAWSERNWETIRPLESEALFEQHSKQLQGYVERKQINKIERICVNYADLLQFAQDNEKDILVVALNSSMNDYIIEETSGKIIKGSKDYRVTNTYKLTFIRKKGIITQEGTEKLNTTNCPNCGAPTNITSSGKCEFCGAVITIGAHDWVLTDMERM